MLSRKFDFYIKSVFLVFFTKIHINKYDFKIVLNRKNLKISQVKWCFSLSKSVRWFQRYSLLQLGVFFYHIPFTMYVCKKKPHATRRLNSCRGDINVAIAVTVSSE